MWRLLTMVLFLSCASGPSKEVQEAKAAVARGALVLDVRTPAEFAGGHVDGAVNLPVQELDAKWATLNVPADREVIVYCASGRRSAKAKELLTAKGVKTIIDVGAMSNWK